MSEKVGQVIWFVGQSGAGKSTAAQAILRRLNHGRDVPRAIWLDGDTMRKVWPGLGFSKEDRWEQNLRIARLARELTFQGFDVVVSSICPYQSLRKEIREKILGYRLHSNGVNAALHEPNVQFIFLAGGKEPSEEYPYEGPDENHK